MPHTLTTLAEVLDDLRAPLRNILGEKSMARKWAKQSPIRGGGKQVLQPLIVADDTGFGWITDGGNIAAASGGDPEELTIPYRYFAGRMRVTGPTIEAAGESKSQLTNAVQWGMERLVSSVTSNLNRAVFSGGRCLGFLNERKSDTAKLWEFSGDTQKVADLITANGGATITCSIFAMDDYATEDATVEISVATAATGLVTIDDALDTTDVSDGSAIAVVCTETLSNITIEPLGIYSALGEQTYFSLDRSAAAGSVARSNVLTIGVADGANTRADVTLRRIQVLLDQMKENTRGESRPSRCFYHPAMHESLQSLFTAAATMNITVDSGGGGRTADGGIAQFSHAGIPFEPHIDCGKGMLIFVQDDTWATYSMRDGDWDDSGGSVIEKVSGVDAVEAYWKEYQNLACYGPNFAGALVGLTFPGEGAGTT